MAVLEVQLIETSVVVIVYIIAFFIINGWINNTLKNVHLQRARRKIIIKAAHLFTTITAIVLLAAIWGLEQHEIAVFASTIFTALGIAFFAQWSLLSNITSSLILFFNHPLKIGDYIKTVDKDNNVEGEITDLTYFFIHLMTKDGEIVTIPNSLILQKAIVIKGKNYTP